MADDILLKCSINLLEVNYLKRLVLVYILAISWASSNTIVTRSCEISETGLANRLVTQIFLFNPNGACSLWQERNEGDKRGAIPRAPNHYGGTKSLGGVKWLRGA